MSKSFFKTVKFHPTAALMGAGWENDAQTAEVAIGTDKKGRISLDIGIHPTSLHTYMTDTEATSLAMTLLAACAFDLEGTDEC